MTHHLSADRDSKNKIMKTILLAFMAILAILFLSSYGYCQDTKELMQEVAQIYTGSDGSTNNLIAGFTVAGLMGGILFGGIGFVAFVFGKRNSEFKPLIIGILLMGYPLFIKNTMVLYLVGIVLTVILFYWRD